jgi:Flp pilus assembly protein CpaB
MNRRVLLLLVLLVVVIGGGLVLYVQVIAPGQNTNQAGNSGNQGGVQAPVANTATPVVVTPVIVAVQELPRGIRIPEGGVDIRNLPQENVPSLALGADQLKEVVGKIARTDIAREQPILATMLVDDLTQVAKQGSDAAAVIPSGLQAITIPIDRNSAVSYALRAGDYVDVIVSFLFVDVDEDFQCCPSPQSSKTEPSKSSRVFRAAWSRAASHSSLSSWVPAKRSVPG